MASSTKKAMLKSLMRETKQKRGLDTRDVKRAKASSSLPADFFDNPAKKIRAGSIPGAVPAQERPCASSDALPRASATGDAAQAPETRARPVPEPTSAKAKMLTAGASRQKQGAPTGKIPEGFFDSKAIPSGDSISGKPVAKGALPEGFLDSQKSKTPPDALKLREPVVRGALPKGFFDEAMANPAQSNEVVPVVKGALPEGFFDNKEADHKARGVKLVKPDIKDELKEFQKVIQEDIQEVDTLFDEEEAAAADEREERERATQMALRQKIESLRKLREGRDRSVESPEEAKSELATADGASSSSEEEDDDDEGGDEDEILNWRAKRI